MDCSMPCFPVLHYFLELAQIYVHWVDDATQPSYPLLSPSPPASIFSSISLFQSFSSSHRVVKVLELQFQHLFPMNIQGWFPLGLTAWISLLSKGPLSLLLHYNFKVSILWCWACFIVQLSHPYMTTGKTIVLTRWAFVGQVMSLLFNMLPMFLRAFLPRSKCLLISWMQSPSTVILEPKKIKSVTVSIVSPSIFHEEMGLDALILVFLNIILSQLFHSPLSISSRGSLVPLHFLQ